MSDLNFGSTVDMLKNGLDGASADHSAIANNVANANTPNFRRSTVSFKEALAATEGIPADPDQLQMVSDSDRDIVVDGSQPPQPWVEPKAEIDDSTQGRVDKSNVDVDQEMAQLAQNSSYSQTMTQLLQVQFMRYRQMITEQP
ncbi:MAG: flagellar basal body rod protein FlgB [Candidatus Eremiobacteraeota bacterium]|nr:flagellar basal body rod protein FlgB [Candidatus Eremiobacteraeota bacterium]